MTALRTRPGVSLPAVVLTAAFVLSRAVARRMGVTYDVTLQHHAWQLLDARLLDDHLWESLWYLHMQPPLYNGAVGVLLELSPLSDQLTLSLTWLAMGAALTAVTYDLLRTLGCRTWWAVSATVVICCGPSVLLLEHWFTYEMPVTLALSAAVAAAARWVRGGTLRWLVLACVAAASATLMRSMLHPIWLVAFVGVAVAARPDVWRRPQVLAAALLPLAAVGGVMVKNQLLFGGSELSSWMGWNLHRVAVGELDAEEREALVADGTASELLLLDIEEPLATYLDVVGPCTPEHADVPALAEELKGPDPYDTSLPLERNLNHECYLPVYEQYRADALAVIRARPGAYLHSVASAAQIWALPMADYSFFRANRDALGDYETWYRHLVLVDVPMDPPISGAGIDQQLKCRQIGDELSCNIPGGRYRMSLTIVAGTLAAVALGVRAGWRWARHGARARATWVLLGGTIGWVTATSILLELEENHRLRSIVEPLTLVVVAWCLERVVHRVLSGRARRRSPQLDRGTPA